MSSSFLLAGLADGLAPKERRYALGATSPNNLGPPLPHPHRRHGADLEFSCTERRSYQRFRRIEIRRFSQSAALLPERARSYSLPATLATNAATFWASWPSTTAAGMTPCPRHPWLEPLGGLGRQPLLIVLSTVDCAGLSVSRLGPTLPTALAPASVWQTPQCAPN